MNNPIHHLAPAIAFALLCSTSCGQKEPAASKPDPLIAYVNARAVYDPGYYLLYQQALAYPGEKLMLIPRHDSLPALAYILPDSNIEKLIVLRFDRNASDPDSAIRTSQSSIGTARSLFRCAIAGLQTARPHAAPEGHAIYIIRRYGNTASGIFDNDTPCIPSATTTEPDCLSELKYPVR